MANNRQAVVGNERSIPSGATAPGQPATFALIVQRVLALAVVCALGLVVHDHPIANISLMVGLGMYAVTLRLFPHAWLLMLPVLLPTIILSPWTGRLLYSEFDFFVVMTLAAGLWRGRYLVRHPPALPAMLRLLLVMLCATQLYGLFNGFFPLQTFDANSLGTYYTSYNALRIGSGFVAALLLFPLLRDAVSSDRQMAGRLLAQGTMLGVASVGLVVLWERGIIHDLLNAGDKYALFGNLLDFSSSYRITALFADMHTGGAAIDGYIAMTLPLCLLPLLERRNRLDRVTALAVLLLGMYVAIVTFSRSTYLAMLVSAAVLGAGLTAIHRGQLSLRQLIVPVVHLGMILLVYALAYVRGGTLALASSIFGFVCAYASGLLIRANRPGGLVLPTLACVAVSASGLFYALTSSKWVENPLSLSIALSIGLGFAGAWLGRSLGALARACISIRSAALLMIAVTGGMAILVQATAGYRMETRFSSTASDTGYRYTHWSSVIGSMHDDWVTRLFGMGSGRFPQHYMLHGSTGAGEGRSTYAYHREQDNVFLRLGAASDLMLGQRIAIEPRHSYRISVRVRSDHPRGYIALRFCYKNILYSEDYNPTCRVVTVPFPEVVHEWKRGEAVFDSAEFGQVPWHGRWPMVVLLSNPDEQWTLDVDDVEIIADDGRNVVANGDFQAGGDRWFSYNDFRHLSGHIKNLWLNVYFDTGFSGLLAVFGLCVYACYRAGKAILQGDRIALVVLAGVIGFLTVGAFDSLVDVPRLSFFFYLLLFLLSLPVAGKSVTGSG